MGSFSTQPGIQENISWREWLSQIFDFLDLFMLFADFQLAQIDEDSVYN